MDAASVAHPARVRPRRKKRNHYVSILDWVDEMRAHVRANWDNVILFTGEPGTGKSTIALQILRALDHTFGLGRIHFKIPQFQEGARSRTPKYGAVLADEFLANRRKAMTSELIELNDFLQICRGLNLHMGICFPEAKRLDLAIFEDRVHWRIHVPRRGVFVLSKRVVRTTRKRGGEEVKKVIWVHKGTFTFKPNSGPFWEAYEARKDAEMRARGVNVQAQAVVDEPELGWDWEALKDTFVRLRERSEAEAAASAPKAEIRASA